MRLRTRAVVPLWLLTLAVVAPACATGPERRGPAPAAQTAAPIPEPIHYTLDNGMDIILLPDDSAPVVATQVWVGVGGAYEKPEEAGIAHVFEHMLFKGTEKRGLGEIGRTVSAAGGDINAYTSSDQTVYHIVIPSEHYRTALDILADATQNSTFDPEELRKELEVVVEEIRRGEDNPERAMYELLSASVFPTHPYGRPVIGSIETVRSLTRPQILDFFHKWYVANNMAVVVTGDFDVAEARAAIAELFGGFRDNPELKPERPAAVRRSALAATATTRPFERERMAMAFQIPSVREEDAWIMDVLSDILSGSSTALLNERLVNELRIASSVFSYSWTPLQDGMFMAGANYEPEQREAVLRNTLAVIFDVANGFVPPERLELAKTNVTGSFIYNLEKTQDMAGQLGWFHMIAGDLDFGARYLARIQALTPEDVAAAAARYIRPEYLSVGVVRNPGAPEADTGALARIVREEWDAAQQRKATLEAGKATVRRPLEAPGAPRPLQVTDRRQEGDTTVVAFDNGTRLILRPDAALPILAVSGGFAGGLRAEPAAQAGITNFMAAVLARGTENLSREEISDRLQAINGRYGMSPGSDATTFNMTWLRSSEAQPYEGLALLAELLQRPTFPEPEVETVRTLLQAQFRQREDDLFTVGLLSFLPAMFGENGYGRMPLGDPEVVSRLQRTDLAAYAGTILRPDLLTLTVVGAFEPDAFIDAYARQFATHRAQGTVEVPPVNLPDHREPIAREVRKQKAQSHIFYGWPAPGVKGEDRYAFEVMNAVMAGMGGRLFVQLRDRQSLAYVVTSILPMRQMAGSYIVYIASAPEKLDEAHEGIRQQIVLLQERGVTDREVEEAKNFLIGNLAVDLQSRRGRAGTMLGGELNGLGYNFTFDEYPDRIRAVTPEDVRRVAREYLVPERLVQVIVR